MIRHFFEKNLGIDLIRFRSFPNLKLAHDDFFTKMLNWFHSFLAFLSCFRL